MEPIRILHVVTNMDKGGLETRLMDIIRNIDSRKILIDIYTNRQKLGYYDNELKKRGNKIFYSNQITPFNFINKVLEFKKFLIEHSEYQIVHIQMNSLSSLFSMGAYLANVPVRIVHSRGADQRANIKQRVKSLAKLPIKKYATHLFSVSKPAAISLFGKKSYESGKVKIIPNAIDCKPFRYNQTTRKIMRQNLNLGNNFTLIHVGNFTHAKNHSFLIDIFYEFKKIESNSVLLLIGGGDDKSTREKVADLDLQKSVVFLGSRNDVNDLLQVGDVFVFPSFYEGLPGAVLEAQASGLPCLISDTITDEVCVLSSANQYSIKENPKKWADNIIGLKDNIRKDTYEEMKEAGYDISSLVERLAEFYENVN